MRLRLFQIVQRAQNNDQVSRWYDFFIVTVAFVSIVPLMFKSEQISPEFDRFLNWLDIITVYILFSDYLFRWITYDIKSGLGVKAFFIYPFTPMAIIDLLSILPSVTILHDGFKFLRILRIVRILRMFPGLTIVTNVFIRERKALFSIIFFMFVYVLAVALVMFTIEPNTFSTFLDALYWSTTALATIGYGDITPVSDLGKTLAIISSLMGIAVIAFPAGIITGGYITQLNKAKEKGTEYFSLPIRHDKVYKGRLITNYKSIRQYFKLNKKVRYYLLWIVIGCAISITTTAFGYLNTDFPLYFDEFGSIIIVVILEPCAGLVIALINDVSFAIYSGSAFSIITFFSSAMYPLIFGIYFRRGRKVTLLSILMVFLVCVIINTVYTYFALYLAVTPADRQNYISSYIPYDVILSTANFLGVDYGFGFIFIYFSYRLIYGIFALICVLLIRHFFWGCKIDPMFKIPKYKRYKYKVYKRGKNEHSYIQDWLEANKDEEDDIGQFDAAVEQGKKSIENSRKTIRKKRKAIEEIQQEVEDRIADIAQHEEEIAKTEEAIGVKKRAVRRVRRRQIVDEKDYIPNVLSKDRPIVDPTAPGAEGVGTTGSFNPIENDNNKAEHKKDVRPKHKADE